MAAPARASCLCLRSEGRSRATAAYNRPKKRASAGAVRLARDSSAPMPAPQPRILSLVRRGVSGERALCALPAGVVRFEFAAAACWRRRCAGDTGRGATAPLGRLALGLLGPLLVITVNHISPARAQACEGAASQVLVLASAGRVAGLSGVLACAPAVHLDGDLGPAAAGGIDAEGRAYRLRPLVHTQDAQLAGEAVAVDVVGQLEPASVVLDDYGRRPPGRSPCPRSHDGRPSAS